MIFYILFDISLNTYKIELSVYLNVFISNKFFDAPEGTLRIQQDIGALQLLDMLPPLSFRFARWLLSTWHQDAHLSDLDSAKRDVGLQVN